MMTIGAVNFHTEDWARLLVHSIRKHSEQEHEIVLVDNSDNLPEIEGATILRPHENIGHGRGLDLAIQNASHETFLALDIDAHVLRSGWDTDLEKIFEEPKVKIAAARGDSLKPFRPCVMATKKSYFLSKGHSFEPIPVTCRGGFMTIDVGVFFALRTLHDEEKIIGMDVGPSAYKEVMGDTYYLNEEPTFYHNWYSSRFFNGGDVIDGLKRSDFEQAKARLFAQV